MTFYAASLSPPKSKYGHVIIRMLWHYVNSAENLFCQIIWCYLSCFNIFRFQPRSHVARKRRTLKSETPDISNWKQKYFLSGWQDETFKTSFCFYSKSLAKMKNKHILKLCLLSKTSKAWLLGQTSNLIRISINQYFLSVCFGEIFLQFCAIY